ncbi:hypothetical protein D3C71_1404980 [compost metagenome]
MALLLPQAGDEISHGQRFGPRAFNEALGGHGWAQQGNDGGCQVVHRHGLHARREHRAGEQRHGQAGQIHEQGAAVAAFAKHHAGPQDGGVQGAPRGQGL